MRYNNLLSLQQLEGFITNLTLNLFGLRRYSKGIEEGLEARRSNSSKSFKDYFL